MKDVVITGIGAVSAHTPDWEAFEASSELQPPQFAPWPAEASPPNAGAMVGLVKSCDRKRYLSQADQRVADKFTAMTVMAAGNALESAGLWQDGATVVPGDGIATVIGTSQPEFGGFYKFGQPVLSGQAARTNPALFPYMARNVACGQICITFGLRGYSTNLAAGPLSGLHAIARAWDLLRTGRTEIALAGGGECLSRRSLRTSAGLFDGYFANPMASFFGDTPALYVPAEGATILVMETLESARARGRQPIASVTGAQIGRYRAGTTAAEAGDALARQILPECGLSWTDIGMISSGASGTGQPSDQLEAAIIEWMGREHRHAPMVTACRSLGGDAEAASSALQVAVAASTLRTGTILPTINADTSSRINVARHRQACSPQQALVTAIDRAGAYAFVAMSAA